MRSAGKDLVATFVCAKIWENKVWAADEVYKGHSESYAESAAENYVEGIKSVR